MRSSLNKIAISIANITKKANQYFIHVAQVPLAIPAHGINVYVAKVTKFKNNKMLVKLNISCIYIIK